MKAAAFIAWLLSTACLLTCGCSSTNWLLGEGADADSQSFDELIDRPAPIGPPSTGPRREPLPRAATPTPQPQPQPTYRPSIPELRTASVAPVDAAANPALENSVPNKPVPNNPAPNNPASTKPADVPALAETSPAETSRPKTSADEPREDAPPASPNESSNEAKPNGSLETETKPESAEAKSESPVESKSESPANTDTGKAEKSSAESPAEPLEAEPAPLVSSAESLDAERAFQAWIASLEQAVQAAGDDDASRRRAMLRWRLARLLADEQQSEQPTAYSADQPSEATSSSTDPDALATIDAAWQNDPRWQAAERQLQVAELLLRERPRVPGDQWTAAADSLASAAEALAAYCPLKLNNAEFCRAVQSYGVTEPFAGREFRPGQEVLLYVELQHFETQPTSAGHETEFRATYRVADANERIVSEHPLPIDRQTSRNRRHDYFIAYRLRLPNSLPNGAYHLLLSIDDVKGRKSATTRLAFELR
ncbi:MAG: hypothetical protein KDA71_04650 [Planctomycetales bacterium]|nr:hypothetical protein [Planctomycetales bacterium]